VWNAVLPLSGKGSPISDYGIEDDQLELVQARSAPEEQDLASSNPHNY